MSDPDPGHVTVRLLDGATFTGDELASPATGVVAAYLKEHWTKLPPSDREASFAAVVDALVNLYATPAFAGWQVPVRSAAPLKGILRPLFVQAAATPYLQPRHPVDAVLWLRPRHDQDPSEKATADALAAVAGADVEDAAAGDGAAPPAEPAPSGGWLLPGAVGLAGLGLAVFGLVKLRGGREGSRAA